MMPKFTHPHGQSRGYPTYEFETLNCAICGEHITDRMGIVSKKQTYFDFITKKPVAVHWGKCRDKYIKKLQRERDRTERIEGKQILRNP